MISFGQQDPNLPGKPLQEDAGEEIGLLLASGTRLRHQRHQLRRLPALKSWHLEKPLGFLEVKSDSW